MVKEISFSEEDLERIREWVRIFFINKKTKEQIKKNMDRRINKLLR